MFKNYTINQTTLPLDMEQYIPETNVAFAVNALVEAIPQTLFNELIELSIIKRFLLTAQKLKQMPINSVLFGAKQLLVMRSCWMKALRRSIKYYTKKKSCLV